MECIEKRLPSYLCSQVFTVLPVLLNLRQELQKERSAKNIKNIIKLINKNLSIAQLTGNTVRGVKVARYRLRKKLQLPPEQNLNAFMLEFKD